MRLRITTPSSVILDTPDIVSLRAADASGSFGILDGHADFLTVLEITVLAFRRANEAHQFCAVRRGVLTARGGREVSIATPEAVLGDNAETLGHEVLTRFRETAAEEESERTASTRLHLQAIRQMLRYLDPDRSPKLGD